MSEYRISDVLLVAKKRTVSKKSRSDRLSNGNLSFFTKSMIFWKSESKPSAFSLLRTVSRSLFEQLLESGQNGLWRGELSPVLLGVPGDKTIFRLGMDPFSGVRLCFLPLCCEDSYKSFKISGGSFLHNWEKKLCLGKLRRFGLWSQRELFLFVFFHYIWYHYLQYGIFWDYINNSEYT